MKRKLTPIWYAYPCIAVMLVGCVPAAAQPTHTAVPPTATATATSTITATPSPSSTPTETPTPTQVPCPAESAGPGKVKIRWFIGLGPGTDPLQVKTELSVVDDFNKSQDKIELVLEVVGFVEAKDTLSAEIASGDAPDIVGPMGWAGADLFRGEWMDLTRLLECNQFDASQFNPALMEMYKTSEGQVALPFSVYPSALIYNKNLFASVNLALPPAKYGDKYIMPDGTEAEWSWDTVAKVARLLTRDASNRNATDPEFDRERIVRYGFTWQYENHPNYWGSFWADGSMLAPGGSPGSYEATAPETWKEAWKWTYDAVWGDQPFMGSLDAEIGKTFGNGNPFNSRKVAMTVSPIWYTCCMNNVRSWDLAAMPAYQGQVGGRIDADTFRIWKGTRHPQEAYTVLAYLTGAGAKKLIFGGGPGLMPVSPGVPARTADQGAWIKKMKANYYWAKNWEVVIAGLNYPDIPGAESYMPNFAEAWNRGNTFAYLLRSTPGLDLAREIEIYLNDLTYIFNQ